MEILIRPWQKEDFGHVRRILRESWLSAYGAFIPEEDLLGYLDATYRIESLSSLYESPFIHGFIGEADGQVVGWGRTQFDSRRNHLFLASLYLLPAFQGKGIGGRLLKAAEERAFAYGLRELRVGVMVQNASARRWYEKRGFRFFKEEPFQMARATVPHLIGSKVIEPPFRDPALQRRILAIFDGKAEGSSLDELAAGFLERQKNTWAGLGGGYDALAEARMREIRCGNGRVKVQFNPRRIVSSGARVDPGAIRRRPCFLCHANLPEEQRAILYRERYLILCNPAPIIPGHLTIAHVCHFPQSFPANRDTFVRLTKDFGPRMIVLYNGPLSGASAPDHLHFQAAPAGFLPVEADILKRANRGESRKRDGAVCWGTVGLGRGMIVIEGEEATAVVEGLDRVIGGLCRPGQPGSEPMMNIIGAYTGDRWRVIVIPRRKHRPDAYFREGAERLLISPGAVDMGGLFITPREEDFLALNQDLIGGIYREVACDDAAVDALLAAI